MLANSFSFGLDATTTVASNKNTTDRIPKMSDFFPEYFSNNLYL